MSQSFVSVEVVYHRDDAHGCRSVYAAVSVVAASEAAG